MDIETPSVWRGSTWKVVAWVPFGMRFVTLAAIPATRVKMSSVIKGLDSHRFRRWGASGRFFHLDFSFRGLCWDASDLWFFQILKWCFWSLWSMVFVISCDLCDLGPDLSDLDRMRSSLDSAWAVEMQRCSENWTKHSPSRSCRFAGGRWWFNSWSKQKHKMHQKVLESDLH